MIAYATELKMPKPNGSRVDVGIERDTGMKITSLTPCGPAAQAGLRVGDIIVRVGSSRTQNFNALRCVLGSIDSEVRVVFISGKSGKEERLFVQASKGMIGATVEQADIPPREDQPEGTRHQRK